MSEFVVQAGLEFTEAGHAYRLGGSGAVSVSRVLSACGFTSPIDVPEDMREAILNRGRRFHASVESFLVSGSCVVDDDNIRQVENACEWIKEHGAMPLVAEFPLCARSTGGYLIAGRVDGVLRTQHETIVVDWKRGSATAGNFVQMAAYLWLLKACGYDVARGLVIDCSGVRAVSYEPTAQARLAWQVAMRMYGANDRALSEWGVASGEPW